MWLICLIIGHKDWLWVDVYPKSKRRKIKTKRQKFIKCDRCGREFKWAYL